MNVVEESILAVFPNVEAAKLSPETRLGELVGWDSMNSINLLVEIESAVGRSGLELILTENLTVKDVVCSLREKGITV